MTLDEAVQAIARWYGTTHANGFEHDHHCHGYVWKDNKRIELPEACTCGWTWAEPALIWLSNTVDWE